MKSVQDQPINKVSTKTQVFICILDVFQWETNPNPNLKHRLEILEQRFL